MEKTYNHNGKFFDFVDIRTESGCLYGRCNNLAHLDRWAWLDDNGFQFEGENRVEAVEVLSDKETVFVPYGCHFWGGEVRNNQAWRKAW